jgi:hypothetical protein
MLLWQALQLLYGLLDPNGQTRKKDPMTKKVFGVVFIVIAAIFILSLVREIPRIPHEIANLHPGILDAYAIGRIIGYLFVWVLFGAINLLLLYVGMKWIRKKKPTE